jgi:mono/diheme cytochrome c family protein
MNVRPFALLGLMLALLVTAGTAAAQQSAVAPASAEPDTLAITPAMIAAGRSLFHGKGACFACHGPNLEGTQVAPTLIKKVWRDAKGGEFKNIFFIVTHGVPSTLMVAFPGGVSKVEALNLASYIWSINNRKEKP